MTIMRRTRVVADRTALRRVRTEVAFEPTPSGTQVMTLAHLVARLAGGFLRPARRSDIARTLRTELPHDALGSLAPLADLPGLPDAIARTLDLAWLAGFDLDAICTEEPDTERWRELAALAKFVRSRFPHHTLAHPDLAAKARAGLHHAAVTLGTVDLHRIPSIPPVYQPLLDELATIVPVRWERRPGADPWRPKHIQLHPTDRAARLADPTTASYGTPHHEIRGALQWARAHLELGVAPGDLAIAAPDPSPYVAPLLALARDSVLPIHVAGGRPLVRTAEGQLLAALADAVIESPSRARIRRIVHAAHAAKQAKIAAIPRTWDARIDPALAWLDASDWPTIPPQDLDAEAYAKARALAQALHEHRDAPHLLAETYLDGDLAALWTDLTQAGPVELLARRIGRETVDDEADAAISILFASLETLAGSPRSHVRIVGLSSSFPRSHREDPLLPERVLGGRTLERQTQTELDAASLEAALLGARGDVVLTYARRDANGKEQHASHLLTMMASPTHVPAGGVSPTPIDERDRRRQQPQERIATPLVERARQAHANRRASHATAHDGVIDAAAPGMSLIRDALAAPLSPTRLSLIVNDPFQFLVEDLLRWVEPPTNDRPLTLDPLQYGSLVHDAIERTHSIVTARTPIGTPIEPTEDEIDLAVKAAAAEFAAHHPSPPATLWRGYQRRFAALVHSAFEGLHEPLAGSSYAEVPFGFSARTRTQATARPWSTEKRVQIAGLEIRGILDHLVLHDADAYVTDFKTGRAKREPELQRSRELQRILYAHAVHTLAPQVTTVHAALHYVEEDRKLHLDVGDFENARTRLERTLNAARGRLLEGHAIPAQVQGHWLPGFAFALPADRAAYHERKAHAFGPLNAAVDAAWEPHA